MNRPTVCSRCHDRGWYRDPHSRELIPCDFEECSAGAGYRSALHPSASPEASPTPPPSVPTDYGAVRRVLVTQLRRFGEHRIARALEAGSVEDLSERERALLDAALLGDGFLVNGKRVDPREVEVIYWPGRSPRDARILNQT